MLSFLLVIKKFLLTPIDVLTIGTQMITKGNYSFQINSHQWLEELSVLAFTFNRMAKEIFNDITHREKTQIELEDAKKIAENATKAKSIFLATMSHEIRTPMNAIIGMSYLARQTTLTPKQKEYIDHVHVAANTLLRIINDILDFSKIEAGKMTIENAPFSLKGLFKDILNLHHYQALEKGINLEINMSDSLLQKDSPFIIGDKIRIGQILNNLLSNAIKFTKEGSVTLNTFSSVIHNTAHITFSIHDTGIGMSEEQLSKLFQEFTQADDSTTRKYGGTGLGLAISKNLAKQMNGNLHVKSKEGEGTIFTLELSFEIEEEDTTFSQSLLSNDKSIKKTLQGMHVLLAEDNLVNQKIITELLQSHGLLYQKVSTLPS